MTARVWLEKKRLLVEGGVSFDNADFICQEGLKFLTAADHEIIVDLTRVGEGGSVLVAVLLQWIRAGANDGKRLRFVGLTDKLQAIIRVSGLKELIPES